MSAKLKLDSELETLKNDASKVLTDISNLSRTLPKAVSDKSSKFKDDAVESVEQQLADVKKRLGEMNAQLKINMEKADRHVHENPYMYILSAVGVGALVGKLFFSRGRD